MKLQDKLSQLVVLNGKPLVTDVKWVSLNQEIMSGKIIYNNKKVNVIKEIKDQTWSIR